MLINNIINNCVNAHFPKVEASTNQVGTQKGANPTNNNNNNKNNREMPKDKKKEAERQRGIRLKNKKENKKLKAFWAHAQEKIPEFVGEFLVVYDQNSSSTNHEDQVAEDQETPKGTEDQETPQQSLGETLANGEGCHDPILDFLDNANLDFLFDSTPFKRPF